jgi:nucleotide-binding universal stress UspA family protein
VTWRDDHGPAPMVIMVGVNGTVAALRAAAYAGGLAVRQHARLVVVFVADCPGWAAIAGAALAAQMQTQQELCDEIRAQVCARAAELDLPLTFLSRRGDPSIQLARAADEVRADMVVVGTSRRHPMGGVARRLMRAGRWPVVVVP